ncbi:hypothetical protein [Pedobacter sp. SYSU D00535]|uniref:hypothetical protein n=1 Tax=Pedobacter sp. SYSU D00535 TaxID=2810308 RepID=UPI001A967BB7|nr:hypothetical protein [Pedobacter sp. SYSU D00535]
MKRTLISVANWLSILIIKLVARLFVIFVPIVILIVAFVALIDQNEETIKISNVGFLMFVALGNVCFSWSRSLESRDQDKSKTVAQMGVEFVIAAILFLIASICKYAPTLNIVAFSHSVIQDVLNGIAFICFILVIVIFMLSIYQFFDVYFSVYINDQKDE